MSGIVTLLSGGLDSTLVTTMAASENEHVHALTFAYGQRHGLEVQSASRIAKLLGINWRYQGVDSSLFRGSGSALVDDVPIPDIAYEEIVGVSPTYVPFRNGVFISLATAYAQSIGAETVMIGAHAEDARGWAYPDCSPEFIGAMTSAIYVGTYGKVRLAAPLLTWTKVDVIREALRIEAPIHLTRSCYKDTALSCGVCPTCRSRLEAFKLLGVRDPIPYQ